MLTTAEILKRVRRIEIKTRGLSNHIFAGEYHSAFKGRGMSFSEVREYAPGDDVKNIDWNVTARMRTPFVKVYEEERELIVLLVVDVSASSLFGTQERSKRQLITEIAAVLAFSAATNNDKVGVLFFSDRVEKFIPPKKGRGHVLRIIRELVAAETPQRSGGTQLGEALRYVNNVQKKRSITFLLSDFISGDYEKALMQTARRHDVIGLHTWDLHDRQLPRLGLVQTMDAESGEQRWIDSSHPATQQAYQKQFDIARLQREQVFRKSAVPLISLRTDADYVKTLQAFFKAR